MTVALAEVPPTPDTKTDWLESWLNGLEIAIRGGMTEDADDFQKLGLHEVYLRLLASG